MPARRCVLDPVRCCAGILTMVTEPHLYVTLWMKLGPLMVKAAVLAFCLVVYPFLMLMIHKNTVRPQRTADSAQHALASIAVVLSAPYPNHTRAFKSTPSAKQKRGTPE